MVDARRMMEEAIDLRNEADEMRLQAEEEATKQADFSTEKVREERHHAQRESARQQRKYDNRLKKQEQDTHNTLLQKDKRIAKIKNKLETTLLNLAREKAKWQTKYDNMSTDLTEEKRKHRNVVQSLLDTSSANESELRTYIAGLAEMNDEMVEEMNDKERKARAARKDAKAARKSFEKQKSIAEKRQRKFEEERSVKNELKDELARVLKVKQSQQKLMEKYDLMIQEMKKDSRQLKRQKPHGRKGGGVQWPLWVVQVCCELLVTGTPPSAIPSNIGILYDMLSGEKADDLPSVNFVRQCRQVVQVLGETMTAMKLSEAPKEMWKQIFFDATTRRQTPFQAVIIGLLGEDGILDPVIVSSCIFLEDESAETTVDNMIAKVT